MEVHWGSRFQVYITPVSETEGCVAMMARDPRLRLEQELADFPEIRSRLSSARPCSPEIGAVSVSRTLRRVWSGQLALIGDASGSVDAITGEGLCLSYLQASALARAFKAGDLSEYQVSSSQVRPRTVSGGLIHAYARKASGISGAGAGKPFEESRHFRFPVGHPRRRSCLSGSFFTTALELGAGVPRGLTHRMVKCGAGALSLLKWHLAD